jgi:hypothetical protein
MARDLDAQLLESVRVRRLRLSDAFVHGSLASRRSLTNNIRRLLLGVMVAAIACASCAGTSFVRSQLNHSKAATPISASAITITMNMTRETYEHPC